MTAVLGAGQTNTVKRVGLFTGTDGLFFQLSGTTLQVVIRKNSSDTTVDQSAWNLDKLDGTGASGLTLDVTKAQIFTIDYQWLGVGRVRFGFVLGGQLVYCHEANHANSVTSVYTGTASLPVAWEIVNTGVAAATSSMDMICAAMHTEGGFDQVGYPFALVAGTGGKSIGATETPLFRLRARSGRGHAAMQILSFQMLSQSAANVQWYVRLNPTVTGGTAPTYNNVNANSNYEFDIASTGAVTGGTLLMSGVGSSQDREASLTALTHLVGILGQDASGTLDELVISLYSLTGGATVYNGALNILEYV